MRLKELVHRSPIRILDRSVRGGLGKGNLGVVMARAGVGKTGFLTCLAIDHMLRGGKVLHVTTSQTVDHVRDFYEEIFDDLARAANLEERIVAREIIGHAHVIQRLIGGDDFALSLERAAGILREHVAFVPDLLIIDGPDLATAGAAQVAALRDAARRLAVEAWMSVRTPRIEPGQDWHEMPAGVSRLGDLVSVAILLHPVNDAIRVRLLRDHDNPAPAELTLDLDPTTLLVREA